MPRDPLVCAPATPLLRERPGELCVCALLLETREQRTFEALVVAKKEQQVWMPGKTPKTSYEQFGSTFQLDPKFLVDADGDGDIDEADMQVAGPIGMAAFADGGGPAWWRKEIDRLNKTPTALAEELKTSMQYSDVFHRKPLPEFRPVADLIGKAELQPVPDHYEGAISQKARGDNRPPWKAVLGKNAWKPLPVDVATLKKPIAGPGWRHLRRVHRGQKREHMHAHYNLW